MKFAELIESSVKDDGNVSAMRLYGWAALLGVIGPYVLANVAQTVQCLVKGVAITFIDIPTFAAGVIGTVITMKAVQAFAEKPKQEVK